MSSGSNPNPTQGGQGGGLFGTTPTLFGQGATSQHPATAATSTAPGGLFGTAPAPAAISSGFNPTQGGQGGGLFGTPPTLGTGTLFGQGATSKQPATAPPSGLFGTAPAPVAISSGSNPTQGGGMFGTTSTFGTLFGKDATSQPATSVATIAAAPLGGLFGTAPAPATTPTAPGAVFKTTPAQATPTMSSGLNPNPTQGGQGTGLFGTPPTLGTGTLFGQGATSQQPATAATSTAPAAAPGALFGTAPAQTTAAISSGSNANPTQGGGLFGTIPTLFGQGATNQQPVTAAAPQGGLFGTATAPTTTPTAPGAPFGTASAQATATTSSVSNANPTQGGQGTGLFGTTPTLFGQGATSQQPATAGATTTAAPQGGLFGTATAGATTTAAPQGGLFGTATAGATTTAAPQGGLFGTATAGATTTPAAISSGSNQGGGLFGKDATSQRPATAGTATAAAPQGGLFGTASAPTTTPAAPGALFGTTPSSTTVTAPAQPAATSTVPTTQFQTTTTPTAQPQAATIAPATQFQSAAVAATPQFPAAPTKMTYKDLNQALDRLLVDFASQERQFLDQVDDLNYYDQVLRKAQDKISTLGGEVDELEKERDRYAYEVDVIGQQQSDLENMVTEMERLLNLPALDSGEPIAYAQGTMIGPGDVQRQNILQLQLAIDSQLKAMDEDMTNVCAQLADVTRVYDEQQQPAVPTSTTMGGAQQGADRPAVVVDQIRQILHKQMDTLSWVDQQSVILGDKVKKMSADVLSFRK